MGAVLILESDQIVGKVIKQLTSGTGCEVSSVTSVPEARRKLISAPPTVVLLALEVIDEALGFCSGLQEHPSLRGIPVVLCVAVADEDIVATGKAAGAAAVIAPDAGILRETLSRYLPELAEEGASAIVAAPILATPASHAPALTPAVAPAPSSSAPTGAQAAGPGSKDQHFQTAQKLLAQVLHNLKTSNLLDVADAEDVPRIVLELTKKVCEGANRGAKKSNPSEDTVDLGAAFQKKV